MEQKVIHFIKVNQLLNKEKTVLVGVSGGPDSLALLHFFKKWQERWRINLLAITVDHQLRGEASAADVRFVKETCDDWNIPLVIKRVGVKEFQKENKIGTQVAARELRYEAFAEAMRDYKADYLALGHHGDDQIETMTMSLIRMTNLAGLAGIPHSRTFESGMIIRPFLSVTKKEIERYCSEHGLTPRIDRTNEDPTYTRNFMRKWVVPRLKEKNENLHVTIQQLSETLQEDEAHLRREAEKIFSDIVICSENPRRATVSIYLLNEHTVSLQRRIFRLTLDYLYCELPKQLTYMHENIFLELLQDGVHNKVLHFPRHLRIEKSYNEIHLSFQKPKNKQDQADFLMKITTVPAEIALPDGGIFTVSYAEQADLAIPDKQRCILSVEQVRLPLVIRNRKPGDRMRYDGLQGSKKLKDIFIDDKIPRQQRDNMFVVADNDGEILWVIGLRKGLLKRERGQGPYISLHYKKGSEGDIHA